MVDHDTKLDPFGLAPIKPQMKSVCWAGLSVTWRQAPKTPEPIKMPELGMSVALIGDNRSRSRVGLGPAQQRALQPRSVFVYAGSDFTWLDNHTPYAGLAYRFDEVALGRFASQLEMNARPADLRAALFEQDESLISISQLIAEEILRPGPGGRIYREALAMVAMTRLLQNYAAGRPPSPRGGLASWQLRTVQDYLGSNWTKDITLQELASLVNLSPTHFCRAFKHSTGRSPMRYLLEIKVENARRLLADSTVLISDVAAACGYESPGQFSRAFRRITGATPTQYRRSC
jgi:AraC family transcriptional regulator